MPMRISPETLKSIGQNFRSYEVSDWNRSSA